MDRGTADAGNPLRSGPDAGAKMGVTGAGVNRESSCSYYEHDRAPRAREAFN